MNLRSKALVTVTCVSLASIPVAADNDAKPDASNGYAKHITVGEHRQKVTPPGWQVFDWLFGWSKPKTGRNQNRSKTNQTLSSHFYVKQSESQGGGTDGLSIWCPGPGDCIGRATTLNALAPTNANGDEGAVANRIFMQDFSPLAKGTFVTAESLRRGGTEVEVQGVSAKSWTTVGEHNLLVFVDPALTRHAEAVQYDTPVWTLDSAAPLEGVTNDNGDFTGWCFALDATRYSDGSTRVLDWLPVVAGPGDPGCKNRDCGARQLRTRWIGQGREAGAPPTRYIPGATAQFYKGPASLAPCEIIEDFEHPMHPKSGIWQSGRASLVLRPAKNAISNAQSRFEIHPGGPPHVHQGVNLRIEKRRGSLYAGGGFAMTNGALDDGVSRTLDYGFATHGVGRTDSPNHFGTAYRATFARNGLEYRYEKGDAPQDNSVVIVRVGSGYGEDTYTLARFGNDQSKRLDFDSKTKRWEFNGEPAVTAGSAETPLMFGAKAGTSCEAACKERGLRCDDEATFSVGAGMRPEQCRSKAQFRFCGCHAGG